MFKLKLFRVLRHRGHSLNTDFKEHYRLIPGKMSKPFWMASDFASCCCSGQRLPGAFVSRLRGRGVLVGVAAPVRVYKSVSCASYLMSTSHCVSRDVSERVARKGMLVACRDLTITLLGLSGNGS